MKHTNLINIFLFATFLLITLYSPNLLAQGIPGTWLFDETEMEAIRDLRQTNPKAFQSLLNERREQRKKELEQLRNKDPEAFESRIKKQSQNLNQRIQSDMDS